MTKSLPTNPSLENLQKQAKSLLKRIKASDAEAIRRLATHSRIEPDSTGNAKLADCQLVLAREYGFSTWGELKKTVGLANLQLTDRFLKFATLTYEGAFHTDVEQANELLAAHPGVASSSIWAAAAAGQAETVAKFLADSPDLVNQKGGPLDREPLLYLCHGRARTTNSNPLATAHVLLKNGANPNARFLTHGTYVFTCVTGAIGEGETGLSMCPPHPQARELVTLLLEHGADPNDSQGLYNSMFAGGTHWLELLFRYGLKQGDLINWAEHDGVSTIDYLLAHAAKKNMLDRVELLLKNGADPNCVDWYQKKPAYELALRAGNRQVIELLVEYGATPIEPESEKQRFYNACMAEDRELVARMTEEDPTETNKWIASNFEAVGLAAESNKLDAVLFMLDEGFPVGDALFEAAWHGRLEMAKVLVRFGASARKRHTIHGVTPIAFADRAGHPDIVDYLLTLDIDIFDAVRFGDTEQLENVLKEEPASINKKYRSFGGTGDWSEHTPLIHAVVLGKTEHARFLLKNGADKTVRFKGQTLSEIAESSGNTELVDLLSAPEIN